MSISPVRNYTVIRNICAVSALVVSTSLISGDTFSDIPRRDPIPYDPFSVVDPHTGAVVSGSHIITLEGNAAVLWGKTQVEAGDYYLSLNDLQKKMNAIGYSLKNSNDAGIIEASKQDVRKLREQADIIVKGIRDVDAEVMSAPPSIDDAKKAFATEISKRTEKSFNDLYDKAVRSQIPQPEVFSSLRENPNIVQLPKRNLKNLVYKEWVMSKGEEGSFKVDGKATFVVGADFTTAEGLADVRIDVAILDLARFNVLYAGGSGNALDSGKVKAKFGVEVLGEKIDRLSFAEEREIIAWRASEGNNSGIWQMVVKNGYETQLMVGPIPVVIEAGALGRVYLDWGINVGRHSVGFSAIPGLETAAYFSGAVGVRLAKTGVEAQLVLLNDEFNLGGNAVLDVKKGGKPQVTARVIGRNTINALNGRVLAFAEAEVPGIGSKRYEKRLFAWPGIQKSGVLFDFRKESDDEGYRIRGAPEPIDVEENNLDNVIETTFASIDREIMSRKALQIVEQREGARAVQAELRAAFSAMLAE